MMFRQLSVYILALLLLSGRAGADPIDSLRTKLFPQHIDQAQCQVISRGPGVNLAATDPEVQKIAATIEGYLKKEEGDDFYKLFHPQLHVKQDMGERIFRIIGATYTKPWQFSLYRAWAINAPDGKKVQVPCNDDGIVMNTMYGYPLQFALWFQVMGQNELGRIFIFIAPRQGQWLIVGWHFQQWTQNGKDYEAWSKAGLDAAAAKDPLHAHMDFDVAQKMLFGGEFVQFPIKEQIVHARDQNMTKEQFGAKAQELFKGDEVIYAGTVLSQEGVGILIREVVDRRSTTPDLQKRCLKKGRTLMEQKWLQQGMGGIRCEFNIKGENPAKEGVLGGFYYSQNEIAGKP